jgi:hypothetical protein
MRSVLLAVILFFTFCTQIFALVYVEKDGIFLYFPESEKEIAARLTEKLPEMRCFLATWQLTVHPPLHIILDAKLDAPEVVVHVIPHREIRIPLRAPGVLEDGFTEADPWSYFMFKGLSLHGIFGIRSGIPGFLYKGFGEIISPNVILPPWVDDGICNFLYAQYQHKEIQDPIERAVFRATPPPDLDIISHHAQIWPGYHGYRIYGKPFIYWLYRQYGWDKIIKFLQVHGRGIIPIEIDLKARKAFGKTGSGLWKDFQKEYRSETPDRKGLLITGYWSQPFVYWNRAGVYPGKLQIRLRGRYGYAEPDGSLWISEYTNRGSVRIYKYKKGYSIPMKRNHTWDPGPGYVAITRKGHKPWVIVFPDDKKGSFRYTDKATQGQVQMISAPPGVIQLSGPVRDARGRIAVAANLAGNWDIWVHDGQWFRLTQTPSIEMDPWWENDTLVYSSNITGMFQIHATDQSQLSQAKYAAILPRQGKFITLEPGGWRLQDYQTQKISATESYTLPTARIDATPKTIPLEIKPYRPWDSIWPNYMRPDIFASTTDLQIGIATQSRDVTGDYVFDAGIRYSFDTDYLALRGTFQVKKIGTQYIRYPLSYETELAQKVDESRNEIKLYWRPFERKGMRAADFLRSGDGTEFLQGFELSANWRRYRPLEEADPKEDEAWASMAFITRYGISSLWGNLQLFTEDRQSLSGGIRILFGDRTLTSLHLLAGRSWGEPLLGHTTFRIGGNLAEGYFTRRSPRLFPLRGFDSNILEAPKAAAAGVEVFWPLANLQMGHQSLPLFLHRLRLGTFVDAGFASENITSDDLLVGAGIELVTSLEIAWGNFSAFRIGLAWPLVQPEFLDQKGPVFVFQLGRPL